MIDPAHRYYSGLQRVKGRDLTGFRKTQNGLIMQTADFRASPCFRQPPCALCKVYAYLDKWITIGALAPSLSPSVSLATFLSTSKLFGYSTRGIAP